MRGDPAGLEEEVYMTNLHYRKFSKNKIFFSGELKTWLNS